MIVLVLLGFPFLLSIFFSPRLPISGCLMKLTIYRQRSTSTQWNISRSSRKSSSCRLVGSGDPTLFRIECMDAACRPPQSEYSSSYSSGLRCFQIARGAIRGDSAAPHSPSPACDTFIVLPCSTIRVMPSLPEYPASLCGR